jgi:hypothetical protein
MRQLVSRRGGPPFSTAAAVRFLLLAILLLWSLVPTPISAAPRFAFRVLGSEPDNTAGAWPSILSSIGLSAVGSVSDTADIPQDGASVVVAPQKFAEKASEKSIQEWIARVERGTLLIIEGDSPLAAAFGFKPSSQPHITAQSLEDLRSPDLRIIWEKPLELPVFELPANAQVFARERWQKAPLMAGVKRGAGAVLWIAAPPGPRGYDRFPYIPQALVDLGLEPPFRSRRLWAFFDSAYRSRVDLEYFAKRWRAQGIGALQVAAWHAWERTPEGDAYLKALIEACHRYSIQVYAWLELPHVSEKFWDDHPRFREKTALLQDAQLDWRKLVNLTNREAFAEVSAGVDDLLTRFDWDGVNLAELYFESLEGVDNPARLTPMNDDVRAEFRKSSGFDPVELFDAKSPRQWQKNPNGIKQFLNYRADLARRQQTEWLNLLEGIRKRKPHLDLVLTHIDDRFDTTMRDKLGADTSRVLPLLNDHNFTFLIEDPATIWNLGPQRYPQIAAKYVDPAAPKRKEKLAIDINIVERYQDVYPTKQQTGIELFQLLRMASQSFPRVALYFENSILKPDMALLGAAASTVDNVQTAGGKLVVESRQGLGGPLGVPWVGPVLVDGRPWPVVDGETAWIPAGSHTLEPDPAGGKAVVRLVDLNAELKSARVDGMAIEFAYQSNARAFAKLNSAWHPEGTRLEIDGVEQPAVLAGAIEESVLVLPRGQHVVRISAGK